MVVSWWIVVFLHCAHFKNYYTSDNSDFLDQVDLGQKY